MIFVVGFRIVKYTLSILTFQLSKWSFYSVELILCHLLFLLLNLNMKTNYDFYIKCFMMRVKKSCMLPINVSLYNTCAIEVVSNYRWHSFLLFIRAIFSIFPLNLSQLFPWHNEDVDEKEEKFATNKYRLILPFS